MATDVKTYFRNENTTDIWLTPPEIPAALGSFDLDPAAPPTVPGGFRFAPLHYTEEMDGLSLPWFGRVWLNPPYGELCKHFMERMADHGNGIALVFARTETSWFVKHVWHRADAVFFFHGRIRFHRADGSGGKVNASAPSCLVAYGAGNVDAVRNSGLNGTLVKVVK